MSVGLIEAMVTNPTDASAVTGTPEQAPPGQFSQAVAITFLARVLMLAGGLGTSIIVARWLGADGLGSLAVVNVTVALAVQLGCFGLPSSNTYFISRDRNLLPSVWANSLVFAIAAGSVLWLALILLARLRPSFLGPVPSALITVAGISIPFQLLTLLGLNVFLSVGQITRFNATDAATYLLMLINAIVAVVLLRLDLSALVTFNAAAWVLIGVAAAIMVQSIVGRMNRARRWFDWLTFKRIIRYGIKFHICVVAGIVIIRADLLLVNHFRGASEAGVYAVAGQMANLILLLPGTIATILFPRVAAEPDPRGEFTMQVTRHTVFIMFLICAAAAGFSFALPLIYGRAFSASTIQLLILLPGVYLMAIESVLVQHFTGTGLPMTIPLFWMIALLMNLVLNLMLIPLYGATAAAVVSSFTYALMFVLVAIYFRAKTGNQLTSALFLRRDEAQQLFRPGKLGRLIRT